MLKYKYSILLFLFAFIIRICLISKGPYNVDCLNIALLGEKTLDTLHLQHLFGTGYPLILILSAIFIFFARLISITDPIIVANFMSVIFGSLCVPLLYLIVKKFLDHQTAFFSAFLLSVCPIILGLSVYGMNHMPALFFLLLGLLFLIKHLDTNRSYDLFISALSFGLLGATRLQDLILIFIPASFIFFFFPRKEKYKAKISLFLAFSFLIAATTLLFHMPYLLGEQRADYLQQMRAYKETSVVPGHLIIMKAAFSYNIMYLSQTLSPLGLILSILGLFMLTKPHPKLCLFFVLWIIIPFLLFINLFNAAPRFQTIILPPLLISQAYLIVRFMNMKPLIKWLILTVFILNIFLTLGHYLPTFAFRHKNAVIVDYMKWLNAQTEEDAYIIGTDISRFLSYYAKRKPMGRMLKDRFLLKDEELEKYRNDLTARLNRGENIYILDSGLYIYDFNQKFSDFIKTHFELEYKGSHLYEDWHKGYLQFKVFHNGLYKIKRKS